MRFTVRLRSCGEYYGPIEGTEIGMMMYYTDALMKFWAINYKNSKPDIDGFDSKRTWQYRTSPIYDDFYAAFPVTRYWLSPSDNGYNFYGKNKLLFSNVSTQLNARARLDFFGDHTTEEAPHPATASFINWWNNHYDKVADYEPQFHKLDQLMKWSILLVWLKDKKGAYSNFEFLNGIP